MMSSSVKKTPRQQAIDQTIEKMLSTDKFITYLMLMEGICFRGTPKNYKNVETIRKMCPPRVREIFSLDNLVRLEVVYRIPKKTHLVALEGFGIDVALTLHRTREARKAFELYGAEYLELRVPKRKQKKKKSKGS